MHPILKFQPFLIPGLRLSDHPSTRGTETTSQPDIFQLVIAASLPALRPSPTPKHAGVVTGGFFCDQKDRGASPSPIRRLENGRPPAVPDDKVVRQIVSSLSIGRYLSLLEKRHPDARRSAIDQRAQTLYRERVRAIRRRAVQGDVNALIALAVTAFNEEIGLVPLVVLDEIFKKDPSRFDFLKAQAADYPALVTFFNRLRLTNALNLPHSLRKKALQTLEELDLAPFIDRTLQGDREAAEALFCLYRIVEEDDDMDRILNALAEAGSTHLPAAQHAVDIVLHEMKDVTPLYQDILPLLQKSAPAVDYLKEIYLATRHHHVMIILASAAEQGLHAAKCFCDILESPRMEDPILKETLLPDINLEFLNQLSRSEGKDADAARAVLRRMGKLGHPHARPAGEPASPSGNGRGATVIALRPSGRVLR